MRPRASVSVSLPADMLDQLEQMSKAENRPRADLLREALAWYLQLPVEEPTAEEVGAVRAGRDAIARGDIMTLDELLDDLDADRRPPGRKGR